MKASDQRGSLILVALAVVSVVSIFAFFCVQNIASRYAGLRISAGWQRALAIADAGVESAIAALKKNRGFKGEKDVSFDGGTFTTELSKPGSAADIWLIRSRSLYRHSRRRTYRKEILAAVRLMESDVEILSRKEKTPIH